MSLDIGTLVGYIDLDTSGAEGSMGRMEGILSGGAGKWSAILGGAGLLAGGAFAGSLSGAMGKEVTLDKLSASLGLSEAESARIGGVAGSLYANAYGENVDEAAAAVGSVMKNIEGMANASSADLEGVTASVMDVVTAFDQDLGMTTAAVGQMIRTGMAKDATEALDLITKGLQGPANKADDLMETMNEYGTQFRKLGLDGKDSMGLISQGVQAGARDADIVADSLKEFSLRVVGDLRTVDSSGNASLTALGSAFEDVGIKVLDADGNLTDAAVNMQAKMAAGGKGARKGLDQILDGLRDVDDPLRQSRNAVALFGTQAEDMGDALYALDLDGAAKEVGKVGGAAEDMGKTLNDNASANITGFTRKLQAGFVDMIGGKVLPAVTDLTGKLNTGLGPAVSTVGDGVKAATGFLSEHSTVALVLAGVIGGLATVTALHSAVMAVGAAGGMMAWLSGTTLVTAATSVWTAVQWALTAALSASPIGLLVVGIAALVAAIVVIATKTTWFQDLWNTAWGAITDAASATFSWVKSNWPLLLAIITGPIGLAVLAVAKSWDKIEAGAATAKDWITEKFGSLVGWFAGLPGKISGSLSNLTETIRTLFSDAMEAGKTKVTGIGGTIVEWIEGIPGKVLGKLADFKKAGADLMGGFVEGMKNAAGVIEGIASNVWDTVKGLLNGAINKINAALDFTINLPGKDLHINIPDIPQLATGGRATSSTLAVIGEGREPESVLPDSVLRGLLERAHAAGAAAGGGGGYAGPLIGQVVQRENESADQLAERLWFKTRTRG